MNLRPVLVASWLLLSASTIIAQQTWTVRAEWVRAHEDFLASDVMQGRGSATHDEQVTAAYVASEFEGYGLKHAPGMTSYIQTANVIMPELDGHATLQAGDASFNEGADFILAASSGTTASGNLIHVTVGQELTAELKPGDAVLLLGAKSPSDVFSAFSKLRRKGPSMVLVPLTPEIQAVEGMLGKTRTPVHLEEEPVGRQGASLVFIRTAAGEKISKLDGAHAELEVHDLPRSAPRQTFNAIGYLPGTDPNAGTILLTAHLDHLGIGRPVNGDSVYNGANDDAAGTTAVLELAHALAAGVPLRRSVLFVCYGSEELGGLGSTYFGHHPPVPLTDLVANLEFEMIGSQDPKMPKDTLLLTGWERSNLGPALKEHGALLGPDPYPDQHFFERSDNYSLALEGVVAHTAAGWGTVPTYHQPNDDLDHLDLDFMTHAIQSIVEPVRWLATSDFRPQWNANGQPHRDH
jgi:peptidase M28-like protein